MAGRALASPPLDEGLELAQLGERPVHALRGMARTFVHVLDLHPAASKRELQVVHRAFAQAAFARVFVCMSQ